MFRVHAFPARDGDCLLLSYGEEARPRHVLVDGGRSSTYITLRPALQAIAERGGSVDLLVLTHIDADHIEGVLELAGDRRQPVPIHEVWFNGFEKLVRLQAFSPRQGDRFSRAIQNLGWCWNRAFGGSAVSLAGDGAPRRLQLEGGGLQMILLSPDQAKLQLLRNAWEAYRNRKPEEKQPAMPTPVSAGLQEMGRRRPMPSPLDVEALAMVPEDSDATVNNGSSIAFIAEWEGKRMLMAGDAHSDLLIRGLRHLASAEDGSFRIDLLKLSHHGSSGNTSRELLELIDCPRFLLSSDGSRHGHPNPETIARILKFSSSRPRTLYFNYRQDYATPWSDTSLCEKYSYECRYPEELSDGQIVVDLCDPDSA